MDMLHVLDIAQPVVDHAVVCIFIGCSHTAAIVMPHNNNVFNTQHFDGVLQYGQAIKVGVHHHVCNISMDKDLAGKQPYNLIRRNPAVGAAYPQVFRALLGSQFLEKTRIASMNALRPLAVVVE